MQITVENDKVTLMGAENFRALSATSEVGSRLAAIGAEPDQDPSHIWIPVARLRGLAGDRPPEWHDSFDAMISKASDHGWVADGMVKVHFEDAA
ncbi:MAG: hypothetical protein ACU0GE_15275 [Pseudooceanicola nanhaiensis]|uniref:hypothetical protein n=1 Tax=Rhodobacterales TaxID=204455 RepID=UPI00405A3CDD